MSRGRIEKALSGFYYVNTGAETLQCRARGKFRREGMSPLVGDWVQVRDLGGLLSPCCASFDLFKNMEDRGEQFKALARAIGE